MTVQDPLVPELRALAAVLRHVDQALLEALASLEAGQVARFLRDPDLEPDPAAPGMVRLRDEARAAALAELRASDPEAEIRMHERCLTYFIERLRIDRRDENLADLEAACIYHLEALRSTLIERREWARIGQHIVALRAARPLQPANLQLLDLFAGSNAIRTQDYAGGEAILGRLVEDPATGGEVRMRALNILAQSDWFQTRYDRALERYRQAHELAAVLGHQLFQAHTSLNMSLVYHEIGYFPQALQLSSQALAGYRELGDHLHEAHAHYEVAKNALQLARWPEAQAHFQASGELYGRLGVQAQQANLYTLQGILAHALGDTAASEALYRQGLAIGASPEHGDPAVLMDSWMLLGLLYQSTGRRAEAMAAYGRAEEYAGNLQNRHVLAMAAFRRGELLRLEGRAAEASAAYEQALGLIETMRGSAEIEEVKLGLLGATQHVYEAAVLLLLERGRPEAAYEVSERARARAFLDLLAAKSPELYSSFDQPAATLAEVQAQLPPDALLIEYYTTGVLQPGEQLLNQLKQVNPQLFEHLSAPPRVIIFAITHEQFEVHEARLDPNLLAAGGSDPRPAQRWLHERKLKALYDQLVAPLAPLLAGSKQLFLIPHGPLHHVPFMALRSPDGHYLLDRAGPAIALAPSATVLVRNCLAPPPASAGAVLAIGYNDPEARLQHAESEARATARILGGEAWAGAGPKGQALLEVGPTLRALHIAGHAVFTPQDPLGSYISLGDGDRLSARAIMQGLRLRPGLVSLSACTSGLTQVVPGDELLGMLRALLYAGATTITCALWEASDIVARLVMEHFYQALHAGATPGVAFRDAIVAVRDLSGRELAAIFARWSAEDMGAVHPPALPEVPPDQEAHHPYGDPIVWASFMLIGRL